MTVGTFSACRKVKDRTHTLSVVAADERNRELFAKSGHRFTSTWPGEAEDVVESRKTTIVSGRRSAIGWDYEDGETRIGRAQSG